MMEKKLFFKIVRVDSNLIDVFFDTPAETKTAYRAIMDVLGDNTAGIRLIARPEYAIILDRSQGGWKAWKGSIMQFVSDKVLNTEGKYSIIIRNESLVSTVSRCHLAQQNVIMPSSEAERARHLPMVVDVTHQQVKEVSCLS